jgi:hypothetical protein
MGHEAIWCRPRTSIPNAAHRKYPYLLRDLEVVRPDQVWCADICRSAMAVVRPAISASLRFVRSDAGRLCLSVRGDGLASVTGEKLVGFGASFDGSGLVSTGTVRELVEGTEQEHVDEDVSSLCSERWAATCRRTFFIAPNLERN